MHIGTRIKLLRKAKDLTLKELSEGIMSIPYLSNIEAGKFEPNKEMLEKLAERLEVPTDYLVNFNVTTMQAREEILYLYEKSAYDLAKVKKLFDEISKDPYRYPSIYQELMYYIIYTIYLYKIGEYDEANTLHNNYLVHFVNKDNYEELPFNGQLAYSYYLGISNYYNKKLTSSLKYFEKLIDLLPAPNHLRANVFYNMAVISSELRRFNESLNHAKKSLQLHFENHNWMKIGELYNFIGVVYWEMGDLEDAKKNLDKSLEIADLKDFIELKKRILHNKGLISQKKKNYIEAIEYFYASITYEKEVNDSDVLKTYLAIADCYLVLDDFDKAEDVLKTATNFIKSQYDHHRIALQHAELLNKKGDKIEFIKRIETVIAYFEKVENRQELVGLYQKAGDYYFQHRKYKDAALYYCKELVNLKELER